MPWIIAAVILILAVEAYGMSRSVESDLLIQTWIDSSAAFYSVDPNLVRAIIKKESSWNPNAINPHDPSYGLGQVTPICAQDYGIVKDWQNPTKEEIKKIYDPQTNIDIIAWDLDRPAKYTLDVVIQMYNEGEEAYLEGKRVPDYLAKVMEFYNEYSAR